MGDMKRECSGSIEQVGLRLPEHINKRLEKKSIQVGISKNALILVLIDLGLKVWNDNDTM